MRLKNHSLLLAELDLSRQLFIQSRLTRIPRSEPGIQPPKKIET